MDTTSTLDANGSSATANENMTPAQKLMAQHATDGSHRPQVEDVVDEEDVAHPPPSASSQPHKADSVSQPSSLPVMSEVAKGKQKAQDAAESKKTAVPTLDTQSEEAFPSLGAPKQRGSVPAQWGKPPSIVSTNGASAPVNGSAPKGPGVNLPGRATERISLHRSQIATPEQLKKPISQVLNDINRRSKARVTMLEGSENNRIFQATGPVDAVRAALKEVATHVGSKQSVKIPIPASVRPHIIGRQGTTIQGISKRTGAKIHMQKPDETRLGLDEDDDDATVEVTVEGDAVAAELARREIEKIVSERTSNVSMKMRDVPAEFYPFLRGAEDSGLRALEGPGDIRLQIPRYHTWQSPIPQPALRGQPSPYAPQPHLPIHISGDRTAAQQTQERIRQQVEALRRQLTHQSLDSIERGRHQFIMGDQGDALHDILRETGCAVIFPPPGDDSDTLYIVGPSDRLQEGVDKVMDLAASMASANVDIARQYAQHGDSQKHARNLARYLQQRSALAEIERRHNAKVVLPPMEAPSNPWEVYSKEGKNVMRARAEMMELAKAHPPQRLHQMDVDPFFHKHLEERVAPNVRREHGVHVIIPDGIDSSEVLLVSEAPGSPSEYQLPRQQPTPQEIKAHEDAIKFARRYLEDIIEAHEKIVQREVEAQPKFHEKIRRYVDKEQQNLPPSQIPVQLLFAAPPARNILERPLSDAFRIRGPSNHVDDMTAKLLAFIKQAEQDELERSYTTTFDFPQKYANFLIGKRGDNIKRLRDEFDVEIQVKDGKVEVQGPQAKAHACKNHILSELKKWEDEKTHVLIVEPEFHKDLIGQKGAQVRRLEDRYTVRINFPRSGGADEATEGSMKNFNNQPANHVVVKGPSKGADAAREELKGLLEYVQKHSNVATVSIAQNQIPSIIGRSGSALDELRIKTKCQIDVPGKDEADGQGRIQIRIKGEKQNVAEAKKILEAASREFDDTVTKTIDVPKNYHQSIIGPKGTTLGKIQKDAGGEENARIIQMPPRDSNDTTIKVVGKRPVVEGIIRALQAFVQEREGRITETLEVAPDKHRLLIGHAGSARRKLESQLNVTLDVPRQDAQGAARSQVRISGQPPDVEKAKEHITTMLKEQEGETIHVPRRYHHHITDNGAIFRRLRDEHKVSVDHGGHRLPPRPAAPNPRGRADGGASMPLITDEPSASLDNHSWEVVESGGELSPDEAAELIPWILRGPPENVARARRMIESALEKAKEPSATGYLVLPDPKSYRFVIGPQGSTINRIRKETGVRINVPKAGDGGEAIEIVGTRDGVEEAKNLILEAVKKPGNGGRRS